MASIGAEYRAAGHRAAEYCAADYYAAGRHAAEYYAVDADENTCGRLAAVIYRRLLGDEMPPTSLEPAECCSLESQRILCAAGLLLAGIPRETAETIVECACSPAAPVAGDALYLIQIGEILEAFFVNAAPALYKAADEANRQLRDL